MKKIKSLEEIQAELENINKETGLAQPTAKPTHAEGVASLRQTSSPVSESVESVSAPEEASPIDLLVGQLIEADTVLADQEDILRGSLNTIGETRDRIQNLLRDFGVEAAPPPAEDINPHMNGVSDAEVQS